MITTQLHGNDFENCLNFCNIIFNRFFHNQHFHNRILITNEPSFKSNEVVTRHDAHFYGTENPH